jgi:hypothetical protein
MHEHEAQRVSFIENSFFFLPSVREKQYGGASVRHLHSNVMGVKVSSVSGTNKAFLATYFEDWVCHRSLARSLP